jgi:hypothetical protein
MVLHDVMTDGKVPGTKTDTRKAGYVTLSLVTKGHCIRRGKMGVNEAIKKTDHHR